MDDPIIEEIRRIKHEFAARFNFDVHAIGEEIRRLERESGREIVMPPKRPRRPEAAIAKDAPAPLSGEDSHPAI